MNRPITPDEIVTVKTASIPGAVFKVFNQAIATAWNGSSATISQEKIAQKIASELKISLAEVYSAHYLDVEPSYREAGWEVAYDKPGYNESYPPTFTFSKKR